MSFKCYSRGEAASGSPRLGSSNLSIVDFVVQLGELDAGAHFHGVDLLRVRVIDMLDFGQSDHGLHEQLFCTLCNQIASV